MLARRVYGGKSRVGFSLFNFAADAQMSSSRLMSRSTGVHVHLDRPVERLRPVLAVQALRAQVHRGVDAPFEVVDLLRGNQQRLQVDVGMRMLACSVPGSLRASRLAVAVSVPP